MVYKQTNCSSVVTLRLAIGLQLSPEGTSAPIKNAVDLSSYNTAIKVHNACTFNNPLLALDFRVAVSCISGPEEAKKCTKVTEFIEDHLSC